MPRADDPVQLFEAEAPRYESLARALTTSWRATTAAYQELRSGWFLAVGLDEPAKAHGTKRQLSDRQTAALDTAIEEFLRTFAGSDRSLQGFVSEASEDGVLQQSEVLAHVVGQRRGAQLTNASQNPVFTASQRRALMEGAYRRLSDGSRFRFESRLLEIRDAMIRGFNEGQNPLAIARKLGRDLDGYWQGRLRTIVRSEMGIASEAAIFSGYGAAGIARYEVIGDPATDELCTARIGRTFPLSDTENRPIFHPGCFCSTVPVTD